MLNITQPKGRWTTVHLLLVPYLYGNWILLITLFVSYSHIPKEGFHSSTAKGSSYHKYIKYKALCKYKFIYFMYLANFMIRFSLYFPQTRNPYICLFLLVPTRKTNVSIFINVETFSYTRLVYQMIVSSQSVPPGFSINLYFPWILDFSFHNLAQPALPSSSYLTPVPTTDKSTAIISYKWTIK